MFNAIVGFFSRFFSKPNKRTEIRVGAPLADVFRADLALVRVKGESKLRIYANRNGILMPVRNYRMSMGNHLAA